MSKSITLDQILADVSSRLELLENPGPKSGMGRFLENMQDPDTRVYAFKWAESAIQEAVERNAYANLKAGVEFRLDHVRTGEKTEEESIKTLIEYHRRETMNRATRTGRSTSPMSNLVDDHELAVNARILQYLEGDFLSSL